MITLVLTEEEKQKELYTPSGYIKIKKKPQECVPSKQWGRAITNCELFKLEKFEANGDSVYICPYCGHSGHIYMQMCSHITSCERHFNKDTQYGVAGIQLWIDKRKRNGMLF